MALQALPLLPALAACQTTSRHLTLIAPPSSHWQGLLQESSWGWDQFLLASLLQPAALWHGGRDTLRFLVQLELL